MRTKILLLLVSVFLLSACDTFFHANGVVVDDQTSKPIPNAEIHVKNKFRFQTDSVGAFQIDRPFLGVAVNVELLVEKEGYVPVFVDCGKKSFNHQFETIRMKRTQTPFKPRFQQRMVRIMYWFDLIVLSLFNLFTLGFVLFNRNLINKFVWILAILLLNTTIHLLYLDGSIVHFSLLNGPVYLRHYWTFPYTLKLVLPIGSIFFWIMYVFSRDSVTEY
jgi:hypothetical protein